MKLIERDIPLEEISRDAAIEMSFKPRPAYIARCKELCLPYRRKFYDPKIRSIHPWPARRPRSACRAFNLAAILPDSVSPEVFLEILGFTKDALLNAVSKGYPPLISYVKPNRELLRKVCPEADKVVVLDPMAGGGSIPLEAASLGVKTEAVEYNPLAYLILKATIEFPAKYGKELYRAVRDEVLKLINYARSELGRFYYEKDYGYIIVRAVKVGSRILPLATEIKLSKSKAMKLEARGTLPNNADRIWAMQHKRIMTATEPEDDLLLATHMYVVKQLGSDFTNFDESDVKRVLEAYRRYLELREELVLPKIRIPRANKSLDNIMSLGLNTFDLLLNPRQALALGILGRYVRERAHEIIESEGEFGAAVALYLGLGLSRVFDFNSILTSWNHNTKTIRDSLASYFGDRKFKIRSVYAEAVVPYVTLEWIFEPHGVEKRETAGGILPVLNELCELLEDAGDKVRVLHGDALKLSSFIKQGIDIVHVDPPYYDVHVYSDMSEIAWNIVRTVLEPALDILFKDSLLKDSWNYTSPEVPRSSEVIARSRSERYIFERKFLTFLKEVNKVLKDDGLLILWFQHREWEAWETVMDAIDKAGFSIVKIYPIASEHPSRLVTRGGRIGFTRALVIVARKKHTVPKIPREALAREVEKIVKEALATISRARVTLHNRVDPREAEIFAKASALALLTRTEGDKDAVKNEIMQIAKKILSSALHTE